ncbi:hypothetical protein [Candidatus Leptofilum sp.]|uniref:hypothetical protein n=1 Tax=Candidatus Leptofilum sp. TaxID=3241576 RepID=UPI003B5AE799
MIENQASSKREVWEQWDWIWHLTSYFGWVYPENLGSVLQRTNNHYFYHMGEAAAVRQLLDHTGYPEVMADEGAIDYYPER